MASQSVHVSLEYRLIHFMNNPMIWAFQHANTEISLDIHFGLGAKSENLSSVAPLGKRNSIDIMC